MKAIPTHPHRDPHRNLVAAVFLRAVEDTRSSDEAIAADAWRFLWVAAPDYAEALLDRYERDERTRNERRRIAGHPGANKAEPTTTATARNLVAASVDSGDF